MDIPRLLLFFQQHQIFQRLTEKELNLLQVQGELTKVDRNHFVIHENQKNDEIYLLVEGTAQSTFINDEGETMAVLFYDPGDLIGIISAVTHEKTRFSVKGITGLTLFRIPNEILLHLLRSNPVFSEKMVRAVSQRLDYLYQKIHEEHSYHAHGLDTYPYRKKIGEIMSAPALFANKSESLLELAQKMSISGVSSLVIVDEHGHPTGIVTQRDIIKALANKPKKIFNLPAGGIMTSPLLSLPPHAFFYDALLVMVRHNIKHVPVINSNMQLEGMITMRNLTKARGNSVLSVVDTLESQMTVKGLASERKQIYQILDAMLRENASSYEMSNLITELNDRLLRRLIIICEQEMVSEGSGPAPVDYCWLALGSEGRREQALGTDQDNAIIFEDVGEEEKKTVEGYFLQLAGKITNGLELCGFPRCLGNVMAVNPRWCHSLSEWKNEIDHWHSHVDGEEIRNFTIFLDFRSVYGKAQIANRLKDYMLKEKSHFLLHRLAEDDAEYAVPLGLFGRIIPDKQHADIIDIKHGAIMHLVNAIRILALEKEIPCSSTIERLRELHQMGRLSDDEEDEIRQAFSFLLFLRIRENMRQISKGAELSARISIKTLTRTEHLQLKKALTTAKWVQQYICRLFHAGNLS